MNQRLHNLAKWTYLDEGSSLAFPNERRRTVILDVNCPTKVRFHVIQDPEALESNPEKVTDKEAGRASRVERRNLSSTSAPPDDDGREVTFLAVCEGRDRLEFAVDGAFDLTVEGGDALVYSADSQDIATRIVAPVILTKIANRRQRNPALELMEYQMKLNTERRLSQLEAELTRRVEAAAKGLEQYAPERIPRALAAGVGGSQPPEAGGSEPSPAPAGEGSQDASEGGPGGRRKDVRPPPTEYSPGEAATTEGR